VKATFDVFFRKYQLKSGFERGEEVVLGDMRDADSGKERDLTAICLLQQAKNADIERLS
jgi:hypothetical protein